jgi:2,3-bisphosphoglycerate-independent phosphoglycerate mutase
MEAALVVLDGWGLGDHDRRNAVTAADTPAFDGLVAAGASGRLAATGRAVGLPDGQMGNSEVGHLTIGAGRIVRQPYTRISDAVAAWRDGRDAVATPDPEPWADNPALAGALDHVAATGGRLHLLGLVSDGGVHSAADHLHALIELAAARGVEAVTHAFTDGRDTPPRSAVDHLAALAAVTTDHATGDVATVCGRYHAMDRDGNWDRTRRAYEAVVERSAPHEARSAVAAVEAAYDRGETDEFVAPTLVTGGPAVADGDAAVWFNFRADRARQFVRLFAGVGERPPVDVSPPAVRHATMTEYDPGFGLPVAFPPADPEGTLGEALADAGLTQLRAAESEKSAHVTYFLDGGRERDLAGAETLIVDSPAVATYDERPGMAARALTDRVGDRIATADPDVLVLNYANPDMVGHTGEFGAAVAAVEAVDAALARLADAVAAAGADLLVVADHGNADDLGTPEDPHTAHTTAPVPFVRVTPEEGPDRSGGATVRADGGLCDVAPTLLSLAGVGPPPEMTGRSLLDQAR